jgi:NAD(P)-dependent dehydrogenase (short-subunit alcohol dehydrogenase family)
MSTLDATKATERFAGKRVLITGGTSGMGLAGARRILAEGGEVVVTGSHPDRLGSISEELPQAVVIDNDASDPDAADALAVAATENGRRLDGLWLNAGYGDGADVAGTTAELFDTLMATNVRGIFLHLAALVAALNDGSSVVVTSSATAYDGSPLSSIYAATKGAVVSAARSWATELSGRGIRVNAIVPGPIDTHFRDFLDQELRAGLEQQLVQELPLGRLGTADEAAAVALFLLSDDAGYVTGSQYAVDGGLVMH